MPKPTQVTAVEDAQKARRKAKVDEYTQIALLGILSNKNIRPTSSAVEIADCAVEIAYAVVRRLQL